MLWLAFGHGLIWSALLTASGAYMTASIPAGRRAEGLSYWGLSSVTRDRRGARPWILGLSPRVVRALRGAGGAQLPHGRDRVEAS